MVWWQRTRSELTTVRLAGPTDRPALADLLVRAVRHFGAAAIEEQASLLNSGASALGLAGDRAQAFLGIRPRTPHAGERWAEVAFLALAPGLGADSVTAALLDASLPALLNQGVTGLVCLTTDSWVRSALLASGFVGTDRVISYIRNNRDGLPEAPRSADLRPAGPPQADTVLEINAAAFASMWRYDDATLLSWLLTAEHPVLAEVDGQAVGFAITARAAGDGYAQLIRIATDPASQGQGIGRQLLIDAIHYGQRTGALGVALNTQLSNATSRHLYEALGFRMVGPAVDVLVRQLK